MQAGQQGTRLMVQVPPGVCPGERMIVERQDGQKNIVVVPDGHFAGSRFLLDFADKKSQHHPELPVLSHTASEHTWTPSDLGGENFRVPLRHERAKTPLSPVRNTVPTSPEHCHTAELGRDLRVQAQPRNTPPKLRAEQQSLDVSSIDVSIVASAGSAHGISELSQNTTGGMPGVANSTQTTQEKQTRATQKQKEEDDLARAIAASLEERGAQGSEISVVCPLDFMTAEDEPGEPMMKTDLISRQIFFDPQPMGSDVCAQHALNHLFQATKVTLDDLTRAEKSAKRSRQGGCFATDDDSQSVHGFFDIEAVKMVCAQMNYELFDVAPQAEWEGSIFQQLADACTRSTKNGKPVKWLLGFLVYDARRGHAQHYTAICRVGPDQWLKLDSLERYKDKREVKNRALTHAQLAHYYSLQDEFFRSWLLRWYPLIDINSCTSLVDDVSAWAAERILRKSKWLPELAKAELSTLVAELRRECLAFHLTISPDETRKALENNSAQADAVQCLISHLQNLPQPAADSFSDKDLIVLLAEAKFDVTCAAHVLKMAETIQLPYATIYQALELASFNTHNARILLSCGEKDLVNACEQLRKVNFDKDLYLRIRLVMNEFRTIPVEVAVEALRQTYDDSRAAIELLKEFLNRVATCVQKVSDKNVLTWSDCEMVASVAVDEKCWNPPQVFARAQQLAENIVETLRQIPQSSMTIESVFSVILIEGSVEQAVAVLRGDRPQNFAHTERRLEAPKANVSPGVSPRGPKQWIQTKARALGGRGGGEGGGNPRLLPAPQREKEDADSNCSVM